MLGKGIRLSLTRKMSSRTPRPVVRLWYDPKAEASRLRGPLWVLLQTVDRCNGACSACPNKDAIGGAPNLMDEGLYLYILDELRTAGSLRALVIMHQNEPLMDRSLPTRIRQAKQALGPGVPVLTVTNGSLLTPRRIDELLEAGVDEVHVSIDAICETTFREVRPGLDFVAVTENTRALLDRSKAGQVTVRFLKQQANIGEEKEFKKNWQACGAYVSINEAANRAGTLREFERVTRNSGRQVSFGQHRGLMHAFFPICTAPFLRLSVLWDGRVAACCEDWSNRSIVGDLSSQSLASVWQGEPMNRFRRMLWTGRYDESPGCRDCSIRFGVGQH